MAWFTCVNYYHFSYAVIYAPRLKDFVLSLGGFVVILSFFFFWKLFTLRLRDVKLPEN